MTKPTIPDRIIGYFDPASGLRRMRARAMMALIGGYTGASRSRRALETWTPLKGDADSDILPDLADLRGRSRDAIRNIPLARGAINTKVTNVIGTGLRLQARIDRDFLGMDEAAADAWETNTEREFRIWAESPNCDAERHSTFNELQGLTFRSTLESGDCFVLLPSIERRRWPYRLAIQLIEADRVSNPRWQRDTQILAGGIEKNAMGAAIAYHITSLHPGNRTTATPTDWNRVQAYGRRTGRRNMLHLMYKERIGQTRGVPDLASVIEPLKQLGRYTDAELQAAVIAGMFTVFVKSEGGEGLAPMAPTGETGAKTSDEDYRMASGAILDLLPGEDITTADPNRPNDSFDPFVMAVLRQVGVALELPFEILIKHFTASYSAARAAIEEAWKFFRTRRQWLSRNFCQPVYETWLEEAVAAERIPAAGFIGGDIAIRKAYSGAEWVGPAKGQIQEKQEVEAAQLRVKEGFSTIAEETAQMTGGDWERKHRQRAKEQRMREEDGLTGVAQMPAEVDDDETA